MRSQGSDITCFDVHNVTAIHICCFSYYVGWFSVASTKKVWAVPVKHAGAPTAEPLQSHGDNMFSTKGVYMSPANSSQKVDNIFAKY